MSINITVFGNRRQNLMTLVEDGSSIKKAIEAAGETVENGQEVRLNGQLITDLNQVLVGQAAGITISGKTKGNSVNVTVFGNRRQNLMTLVEDGLSVKKAIEAAGETVESGQEVRVNGQLVTDLETRLTGTAAGITISGKTKGNVLARVWAWLMSPLA